MAQGVRHKPTPETRAQVSALVSFGVKRDRIAEFLGLQERALLRWYADELATGDIKRNSEVAGFLFTAASGQALEHGATYADCVRAAMFWLKTRAQWRETNNLDVTSSDGSMSPKTILSTDPVEAAREYQRIMGGKGGGDG